MISDEKASSPIEWKHVAVIGIGVAVLSYGVRGFHLRGHFGLLDALYCLLMLIPAAAYLLVTSYVLQHAALVVVIPLFLAFVLVRGFPAFAVALGLALVGVILDGVLREWKNAREADGR
jgi:hypothetical protein